MSFLLYLIIAFQGVPYKTLALDGFPTMYECEQAMRLVVRELPASEISMLACIPVIDKRNG